jgi:hypothetical protein
MNTETKTILGKLLGEVFRIQKRTGVPTYSDGTIYGLLNGVEPAIDSVINEISFVSTELVDRAAKVLQPIFDDPAKLAAFNGFYDIEHELQDAGIDRGTAIQIFLTSTAQECISASSPKWTVMVPLSSAALLTSTRMTCDRNG